MPTIAKRKKEGVEFHHLIDAEITGRISLLVGKQTIRRCHFLQNGNQIFIGNSEFHRFIIAMTRTLCTEVNQALESQTSLFIGPELRIIDG